MKIFNMNENVHFFIQETRMQDRRGESLSGEIASGQLKV